MSFVDDYSRKVWVSFLKTKDEAFTKFVEWKELTENQSGKKLKTLRTDNGLEYCNKDFEDYCKRHGVLRHKTCPYTPQQNGIAERLNRTILEKVRSLLSETGLGERYWAETTSTVVYMINRTPSKPLNFKIPEEVWSGRRPQYSHMKRFGCLAYYYVSQGKLKPRAKKGVFLGYPQGVKGYRIWSLEDGKCVITRDVIFCEETVYKDIGKLQETVSQTEKGKKKKKVSFILPNDHGSGDHAGTSNENVDDGGAFTENEIPEEEEVVTVEYEADESAATDESYLLARDRERRVIRKPSRFVEDSIACYAMNSALTTEEDEPRTFEDAMRSKHRDKWMIAMEDEIDSMHRNDTWKLIKNAEKERTVGCRWIYTIKPGIPGIEKPRFKARLVAKGFSQIEGIDYHEIFSPVVKHVTIRLMLAIVVQFDMELEQLDVKTAFLHGCLDERILMDQPKGFTEGNKVCLLRKSIYGLKQSSRQWNLRFSQVMKDHNYLRSEYDPCVYFKRCKNDNYIYLLLYVDDMLVASKDFTEIKRLKKILSSEFEMKDLGASRRILGMDIVRNRVGSFLKLSQSDYLAKVVKRFNMQDSRQVSTPMGTHFKLKSVLQENKADTENEMRCVPYSSAVGSLMYAMVGSRPDLAYAVGLVSRFMSCPDKQHWEAVKWVLRYVKQSANLSLTFRKSSEFKLKGYCDSDWGADLDRRRSITGYTFQFGCNTVSWRSGLQQIVALSTTESEYMALVEAVRESLWLKGIAGELGFPQNEIEINCDSQSAIYLVKSSMFHERTKHMALRLNFVRDVVESGSVKVVKIGTLENPADIFTKSVPVKKFEEAITRLGLSREQR